VTDLARLTVRGFKSIRELENFELTKLNVLIGANGAGKSNFIGLFRLLAEMLGERLQSYVKSEDGPDALLYGGRKRTSQIDVELVFGKNGYHFTLAPAGNQLVFSTEETYFVGSHAGGRRPLGNGHTEARLPTLQTDAIAGYVSAALGSWRVFHFHDTSASAMVRHAQPVRDNLRLKPDASNLAPFLRMLRQKHPDSYSAIVETVRMVVPFFHDFVERKDPDERIELEWFQVDDPDTPLSPLQLSDGTLRFICLATLLLQPRELQPATIVIDEPELGLHPFALVVLASLLQQASERRQIIASTQSVDLVNQLAPADVIVTETHHDASVFHRLDASRLEDWLHDYALGELWKMNVVGGRPSR
jgi:predicted ATPase